MEPHAFEHALRRHPFKVLLAAGDTPTRIVDKDYRQVAIVTSVHFEEIARALIDDFNIKCAKEESLRSQGVRT